MRQKRRKKASIVIESKKFIHLLEDTKLYHNPERDIYDEVYLDMKWKQLTPHIDLATRKPHEWFASRHQGFDAWEEGIPQFRHVCPEFLKKPFFVSRNIKEEPYLHLPFDTFHIFNAQTKSCPYCGVEIFNTSLLTITNLQRLKRKKHQ